MRKSFIVCIISCMFVFGCASMFMKGGALVDAGYKPQQILIKYRAEGTRPVGVEYWLVETEKGPAIFERSQDGSGALFLTRWTDKDGDHYAGWVATSHAFEYVIAPDKSGKKYVYPKGYYSLETINGIERPVPAVKMEPVATLIPKK